MEEKPKYQELLEYVIMALVDHPEAVQISRRVDEMGVLLTLKVHVSDMGQVIGRQGSTARAIRTLVRLIGLKSNARVNLKIEEPDGGQRAAVPAAASAPEAKAESRENISSGPFGL